MDAMNLRGFLIHPAFQFPVETLRRDVDEDDLPAEWRSLSDDEQDALLVANWRRVCDWALSRGVDRAEVSDFPKGSVSRLLSYGFTAHGRETFLSPMLSPTISSQMFEIRGSVPHVNRALRSLATIPYLNLIAYVGTEAILSVEDMTWDAVFIYAREEPELEML